MNEFERIEQLLAPLAANSSVSFGLKDDVAQLPGKTLIVTSDTIIEGVHYIGNESADLIAKKLLRCNLSDLAAKGAAPKYYTLNISLGDKQDDAWLALFAKGLEEDQQAFGLTLIGGDSTSTSGPCVLSATLFGDIQRSKPPLRENAKIGDVVCVTGTIGDAAIGLKILKDELVLDDKRAAEYFIERYQLPRPRIGLGQKLAPLMNASMDISDGLMQDVGHITDASNVAIEINASSIPLSAPAKELLEQNKITLEEIVGGGDDYEILCTMNEDAANKAKEIAQTLGEKLTTIGTIVKGSSAELLDTNKNPIQLKNSGYMHQ